MTMSVSARRTHVTTTPNSRRRPMTGPQCVALLREIGWGVLAVVECTLEGTHPLGTPTAYALDDDRIYLAMSDGRKLRALERNPHLCLTVTDVRDIDRWRSVLVMGRPRWLVDPPERRRAIAAFLDPSRPRRHRLGARDARRLAGARLLALRIDELHGFESG